LRQFETLRRLLRVGLPALLLAGMANGARSDELSGFDCLIEPNALIRVSTREVGIIETLAADRGDVVSKGQELAQLESGVEIIAVELARARANMRGTVDSRRAAVSYRGRQADRVKELYKNKAASFTEQDQAVTDLLLAKKELQDVTETMKLAEIELRRAEQALAMRTIKSPVDGMVVQRLLLPGESVENKPIIAIAAVHPLNVEVILPVQLMNRVRKGMKAEVLAQMPGATPRQATITVADRLVDAASNTFGVRLELPNEDYSVPGGIRCDIRFLPES
jgi:RND family efflux transporter MFP subunit